MAKPGSNTHPALSSPNSSCQLLQPRAKTPGTSLIASTRLFICPACLASDFFTYMLPCSCFNFPPVLKIPGNAQSNGALGGVLVFHVFRVLHWFVSFHLCSAFDLKEEEAVSIVKSALFHWKPLLLIITSPGVLSKGLPYLPYVPCSPGFGVHMTQRGHDWLRSAGESHSLSHSYSPIYVLDLWSFSGTGPFILF